MHDLRVFLTGYLRPTCGLPALVVSPSIKAAAPIIKILRTDTEGLEGSGVSSETEAFCEGSVAALAVDVGVGID